MKRIIARIVPAVLLVLLTSTVYADISPMPSTGSLKPFTAQTHFMSLNGYFRWVIFQQKQQWVSIEEVQQEMLNLQSTPVPPAN